MWVQWTFGREQCLVVRTFFRHFFLRGIHNREGSRGRKRGKLVFYLCGVDETHICIQEAHGIRLQEVIEKMWRQLSCELDQSDLRLLTHSSTLGLDILPTVTAILNRLQANHLHPWWSWHLFLWDCGAWGKGFYDLNLQWEAPQGLSVREKCAHSYSLGIALPARSRMYQGHQGRLISYAVFTFCAVQESWFSG